MLSNSVLSGSLNRRLSQEGTDSTGLGGTRPAALAQDPKLDLAALSVQTGVEPFLLEAVIDQILKNPENIPPQLMGAAIQQMLGLSVNQREIEIKRALNSSDPKYRVAFNLFLQATVEVWAEQKGIILVEERHYQDHLEKAADLIREDQGKGVFRRVAEAMFNRDAKLAEDMVTMCRQLAVSKQELEKELASANMRLAAVTEKTNLIMESANSIHAQAVEELARARKEAEKILQAARKTEASVLQRSEGIQQESDGIIDSARAEARRTQKQLVSEARKEADAILAAARKEALKLQVNAMKGTKLQELKRRESELEKRIALNESSLQELGEEEPHLKMNVLNSLVYARVNVDCGTLLNSVAAGTFRISEANNHVLHSLAILTKDLTRLELQEKTCKTYLDNLYALTSQSEDCGSLIRRYVNILEKEGILGLKDCIPNFAARMGLNE